ncbi:MAG: Ig-like domain-containing protein [Pseudomonadota bacterium]
MFVSNIWVRLALLAALCAFPLPAMAQISAVLSSENDALIVSGLSAEERLLLTKEGKRLKVSLEGAPLSRGMAIDIIDYGQDLIVEPSFPFRKGTRYVVNIELADGNHHISFAVPNPRTSPPKLTGFEPSQSTIPANTLRLYLKFSEPMARGSLLESISLLGPDGAEISNPFLNLETELWDPTQTRATLLFDPGRIKQGIGPNIEVGAPLKPGENYRVVVRDKMRSAAGVRLDGDQSISFRVGDPERRAINPEAWTIIAPPAETYAPLSVSFDRIMDTGAIQRLLTLSGPSGQRIIGNIDTDGGGWTLSPNEPWQRGDYQLIIAPDLEDVSGNTIGSMFDAEPDTIGKLDESKNLSFRISTR